MEVESLCVLAARVVTAHHHGQLIALPADLHDTLRQACPSVNQQIRSFGDVKAFHDNGTLQWHAMCVDGEMRGKSWWFDESGYVDVIDHRKAGVKHGLSTSYGADGRPIYYYLYKDGQMLNPWTRWENVKMICQVVWDELWSCVPVLT